MSAVTASHVPAETDTPSRFARFVVVAFLLSMPIPFFFWVGSLQLTPTRLLLLIMTVPCVLIWMRGGAGRVRVADIATLMMWFWTTLAFAAVEGMGTAIEAGGVEFMEAVGSYLIARCFIRTADDFYAMVKALFWITLIMLPAAIYETITAHNIILDFAWKISASHYDVWKEARWGLDRVQGAFAHPILFGVFCGSIMALAYYVLGYGLSWVKRWTKTFLVTFTAFLSLSSGPATALVAQAMLIGWDFIFKAFKLRWVVLLIGFVTIYTALEIASNRSVPQIFISYFAFDSHTASNRLRIWYFGTQSVANFPMWGIGFGEWERPRWMSASMDMFWLVKAVRHGLPTALFTGLALLAVVTGASLKRGLSDRQSSYRTGYVICMISFFLVGWTVNFWKDVYVLYMFMLGAGSWIMEARAEHDDPGLRTAAQSDSTARRRTIRYSRPREALGLRNPRPEAPMRTARARTRSY